MKLELAAGTILDGKYRIRRTLGHGGMGTVFEAENSKTGKRVALKCIDPGAALDPESAERLLREAQATSRIRHPNVVDVYDVGRDGELVFLVMEYLDGELLSQVLARRSIPAHRLIALLLPAMRGVAEAHRQGVVHRDIKPENIFLAKQLDQADPVPKVLDFGISKLEAREQQLRALTAAGRAVGTPRYMSYEQVSGEHNVDGRADVYAFAVILYEALTGRVPYDADTFSEVLRMMSVRPVVPPRQLNSGIPRPLEALVLWALERDRLQRISSMDAFVRELEPFATERGYRTELTTPGSRLDLAATRLGGFHAPEQPKPTPKRESTQETDPVPRPDASAPQPRRYQLQRDTRTLLAAGAFAIACIALGFALRGSRTRPAPTHTETSGVLRPRPLHAPEPTPTAEPPRPAPLTQEAAHTDAPSPTAPLMAASTEAAGEAPSVSLVDRAPPLPAATLAPQAPAPIKKRAANKPRDFGIY